VKSLDYNPSAALRKVVDAMQVDELKLLAFSLHSEVEKVRFSKNSNLPKYTELYGQELSTVQSSIALQSLPHLTDFMRGAMSTNTALVNEIQSTTDTLKKQLSEADKYNHQQYVLSDVSKQLIGAQKREIRQLKSSISEKNKEKKVMEEKLSSMDEQSKKLEKKCDEFLEKSKNWKNKYDEAFAVANGLRKECEEAMEKLKYFQRRYKELKPNKFADLQKELCESKASVQVWKGKYELAYKTIRTLESQLKAMLPQVEIPQVTLSDVSDDDAETVDLSSHQKTVKKRKL
jgi:chromosome segregation ATPase